MNLTWEQERAIEKFCLMADLNPLVKSTTTIKENSGCGIYHTTPDFLGMIDLPCLAVAETHDGHFFGLGMDLKNHYFEPQYVF